MSIDLMSKLTFTNKSRPTELINQKWLIVFQWNECILYSVQYSVQWIVQYIIQYSVECSVRYYLQGTAREVFLIVKNS